MKKISVGIVGGAGYTGGELLRLLLFHPAATIAFIQSTSNAYKPIYTVHTDLLGESDMLFSKDINHNVDIIFLCGAHHTSVDFMKTNQLSNNVVVIDLSQDFRHNSSNTINNRQFIYGLPELNREGIKQSNSIANPGCFATAIQLALLPLAANQQLSDAIHINAITGSTGAGQAPSATTHFSWRDNNVSAYKAFMHQHITEITESVSSLQNEFNDEILFVPQRGSFARGIFATVYTKCDLSETELQAVFHQYYSTHPFVTISTKEVDLKQVVNTNRCFLHITKQGEYVLITSVIDNLLKGASGQAIQNMNLIFNLPENTGLQLKPSAF